MRSLSASVLLWTWSSSEWRLDMAGNTWRSRTFVYGPCGACSSSIHPRVENSFVSQVWKPPSLWGPKMICKYDGYGYGYMFHFREEHVEVKGNSMGMR